MGKVEGMKSTNGVNHQGGVEGLKTAFSHAKHLHSLND